MSAKSGTAIAGVLGGLIVVAGLGVIVVGVLVFVFAGMGAGMWVFLAQPIPTEETVVVEPLTADEEAEPEEPSDELAEMDAGTEDTDEEPTEDAAPAEDGASRPAPRRTRTPSAAKPPPPVEEVAPPVDEEVPDDMVTIEIAHQNPGVTVMVDGVIAGNTPLSVRVEAGPHQIRLKDGKATGQFSIDAGFMQSKWCYASKGKKIDETGC